MVAPSRTRTGGGSLGSVVTRAWVERKGICGGFSRTLRVLSLQDRRWEKGYGKVALERKALTKPP